MLDDQPPAPIPIGHAALRRAGDDLAIISYGAYVHVALRIAERLAADGRQAAVLDLRSLAPLDRTAILAVARHCARVLIVHEDSRTGGIGESIAAMIQEEAFELPRCAGADHRRARYARPVFAAARELFPAIRGGNRASRQALAGVLTANRHNAACFNRSYGRNGSSFNIQAKKTKPPELLFANQRHLLSFLQFLLFNRLYSRRPVALRASGSATACVRRGAEVDSPPCETAHQSGT